MTVPIDALSFVAQLASGVTASYASNPITWIQVIGAGTVTATCEDGSSATFTCLGGEVIPGVFSAVTANSATRLRVGNGQAPNSSVSAGAPLNLAGGSTSVTGLLPTTNYVPLNTAASQAAAFSATVDTIYPYAVSTAAFAITFPAITAANDGHKIGLFNNGTTAATLTPTGTDAIGGTAASSATAAGPAAGVYTTYTANVATGRWLPK